MKTVTKKVSELKHPSRNVRMHPDKQIKEFVRSLKKFGQTRPFVIDENNEVLIGNGMLEAMKVAGFTEASCIVMEGLTPNEKKQLMMSDNKIFSLGSDDMDVFEELIRELDGDFDIPGYSEDLLKALVSEPEDVDGIIIEYGTVPADRAEAIRSAGRDPEPAETATEPVATAHNAPSEEQTTETTPTRSYVICPKCGEKIWL